MVKQDDLRKAPRGNELRDALFTRRQFIATTLAATVGAAVGCDRRAPITQQSTLPGGPTLATSPFALGVASGDPTSNGVILWTRLTQDPLNGGGMSDAQVAVGWQIAEDEAFTRFRGSGWSWATKALGHSLHIDVSGLAPNRWYYYRFFTKDWVSPVGRTRTLPEAGTPIERLRVGIASCQNYTAGYFTPMRYLAEEPGLDLILFLGDYIYESSSYKTRVHSHDNTDPVTLDEYRDRYAQYHLDPDLALAHRRHVWFTIWDDHEVTNNYGGYQTAKASFKKQVVDAYQAFYEHIPMRAMPEGDGSLMVHQIAHFGDLVQLNLMDTRQFRSHSCDVVEGKLICNGTETMLGADQERWLLDALVASTARWTTLITSVVFSETTGGGLLRNEDQWDGYPAARQRILDQIAAANIKGVMALSGDIHTAALGFLTENPSDYTTRRLGAEIVTNSVTTGGSTGVVNPALADFIKGVQPNVVYIDGVRRGYSLCEVTRDSWRVDFRNVDTVDTPDGQLSTHMSFTIDRDGLITEL